MRRYDNVEEIVILNSNKLSFKVIYVFGVSGSVLNLKQFLQKKLNIFLFKGNYNERNASQEKSRHCRPSVRSKIIKL